MGAKIVLDPTNVVQSLVYTLLDVLDATRDLHQTLLAKKKRDYEQSLRSRGYPSGRGLDYADEEDHRGDTSLMIDKTAVKKEFEHGLREVGPQFAIGDVLTQTAIQSQIITLQSVIITTFLYGPTTPDPISKHLSTLLAASRDAGTSVVDALGAQQLRQLAMLPPPSRSVETRSNITQAPPYPVTTEPTASSASTALVKSRHGHETAGSASTAPVKSRHGHEDDHVSSYPEMTTILRSRPTAPRTDTESTALSSYAAESVPQTTCCLYAADLQRSPHQTLSSTVTQESTPYCPYCKRTLQLSPGKSWEVLKAEGDRERCFRVHNRFVVKCHRDSPDGGYCCVLCSRGESSVETVCGDVKALIKHVWQDHSVGELELEEDVDEVVEQNEGPPPRRRPSGRSGKSVERRRDSGMGASSRRSVSLGPRSGRGRKRFEREVETLEVRAPRRGSLRA